MAAELLILAGVAALVVVVVVVAVVALVVALSGRGKPTGVISPDNAYGAQAAHGHAERTNIQHNVGDLGPGI